MSDQGWDEEPMGEGPAPEPVYESMFEFFEQQLAPGYCRQVDARGAARWCPQWWRHPEAAARMDAMWRAWEVLRLDPQFGISQFYREHADHHMAVLLDEAGPFAGCSATRGHHSTAQIPPLSTDTSELVKPEAVLA